MNKLYKNKTGFSLVELMISMSVFTAFVTVALGSFAYALRTQRQANAMIATNNSISLTIEQIMREMRTGYNFCIRNTAPDCSLPYSKPEITVEKIYFYNSEGEKVGYYLSADGEIIRDFQGNILPITPQEVVVERLNFIIRGGNGEGGESPLFPKAQRITIIIKAKPDDPSLPEGVGEVSFQTTVSPRFPG